MKFKSSSSLLAVFALLHLLNLASGCGSAGDSENYDSFAGYAQPHYLDPSVASKEVAMSGQVSCGGPSADCSPSVGMLASYSPPSKVAQCTAFLVGPQIAITNSHCIPDDLKNARSSCADRLWLYFPDLPGYPGSRIGCSEVLVASDLPPKGINKIVPDYAVLRLDHPVNRPTLAISRDGLHDQSTYQLVKIDPLSETSVEGAMVRTTCRSIHGSILVPGSTQDDSPNMSMADCQVIEGNSGSPLVDADGTVHGLIQITVNQSKSASLLPVLDGSVAPQGIGTNFSCLDFPGEVSASPMRSGCSELAKDLSQGQAAFTNDFDKKLEADTAKKLSELSVMLDSAFQWSSVSEYDERDLARYFLPIPTCITNPKRLLKGHHHWYGGYESKGSLELNIPMIEIKGGVSRYLTPDYRVLGGIEVEGGNGFVSASLSYDPAELKKKGTARFVLSEPNFFGADRILSAQVLGPCK